MPRGDLLNWDFTDKQKEEMLRQLQPKQTGVLSKHDDYVKAVKDYKKNMNKVSTDSRCGFNNPWRNKIEFNNPWRNKIENVYLNIISTLESKIKKE